MRKPHCCAARPAGLVFLLLLSASFLYAQSVSYGGKPKPLQTNVDIRHYTIALTVDIPGRSLSGYTTIRCLILHPTDTLLFDLMDSFLVSKVFVNDKPVSFIHKNHQLYITSGSSFLQGPASVRVNYSGRPMIAKRPPWDDGFTFTTDSAGHPWVAVTAEGTGGKLYFPCKDDPADEPNEGADLIITVPRDLKVAGPGLLIKVTQKGGLSTYHWQTHYPINNYSIVFNIGDYQVVSRTYITVLGNKVPMQFYVLKAHASQAPHLLEMMEVAAHVKEKYFGEYPWVKEKIGLVETPHLGMEHQTMNAYGNKFRYTKIGGLDFDWLMNHELGHEWWGNKVTAGDWADYWIHEGIGSFGDALYTRDKEGEEAYEKIFRTFVFQISNDKPVILGKDIAEEDAYHGDIYVKGAFFMHTLRYVLGDSLFFPALKKLATDSMYTYANTVKTEQVEKLFSQAYGRDLSPLFTLYLRTTGKLIIHVRQVSETHYRVRLDNLAIPLPLDITSGGVTMRNMVDPKGILVASEGIPLIDTKGFYLKQVVYE